MIFHCDNCKVNSKQDGRCFFPEGDEVYTEGSPCPHCGQPLQGYEKFEDWP